MPDFRRGRDGFGATKTVSIRDGLRQIWFLVPPWGFSPGRRAICFRIRNHKNLDCDIPKLRLSPNQCRFFGALIRCSPLAADPRSPAYVLHEAVMAIDFFRSMFECLSTHFTFFSLFFSLFLFEVALAHVILPAPRALWFCSDSTPAPCRRARHLDRLVARSAPILLACLLTQAVAAAASRHWCVLSCGTLALPLCIVRPFSRHLLLASRM